MVEATERSMPPVAMTNVWPIVSTIRIALACRIAETFPSLR